MRRARLRSADRRRRARDRARRPPSLRGHGRGRVDAVQADLATIEGVDQLCAAAGGRPVDALLANAGRGLGDAFLDQDFGRLAARGRHQHHRHAAAAAQGRPRHARGAASGRILITGSIAGFMPGTYQAVYNGTKAFLDTFSFALRHELEGQRRHGHLPDAGRHRDRVLRARRHAGHQGRPVEEGRSGRWSRGTASRR